MTIISKVHKMQILNGPKCTLWNNTIETMVYAFIECPCITYLWRQLEL